jgi:hypothetical protein
MVFNLGSIALERQDWQRAKRPEQFCSVDQGICGHLTRRNLAALATERGSRS